jgi:hypothetical protein
MLKAFDPQKCAYGNVIGTATAGDVLVTLLPKTRSASTSTRINIMNQLLMSNLRYEGVIRRRLQKIANDVRSTLRSGRLIL